MRVSFLRHFLKLFVLFSLGMSDLSYLSNNDDIAMHIMLVIKQGMPNDVTCFVLDQRIRNKSRCFLCCDKYLVIVGNTLVIYKEDYYKEIDSIGLAKIYEFRLSPREQFKLHKQLQRIFRAYSSDNQLIFRDTLYSLHEYHTEIIISDLSNVTKATLIGNVCVPVLDSLIILCNRFLQERGVRDSLISHCKLN